MVLDVAGVVFAETRDLVDLPALAGSGQQQNELGAIRRQLAYLIQNTADGVGFAAPEQPTVADLGKVELFEAWKDCVAAAEAPTLPTDPKANIAFFANGDPQQEPALTDKYQWLPSAAKAVRVGRAGKGNTTVTLWLMRSDNAYGRYPDSKPRNEYVYQNPIIKTGMLKGGALFVICLALLIIPAFLTWSAAKSTVKDASGKGITVYLENLNILNSHYAELVAKASSDTKLENTNNAPTGEEIRIASQAVTDAINLAYCPINIEKKDGKDFCSKSVILVRSDVVGYWLTSLMAIVFLLALISWGIRNELIGFLIDERGRMSLSRFQFVVWSVVILSAYWTAAAWDLGIATEVRGPVLPGMTQDLWILLGIVTASPLASSLILTPKAQPQNAPSTPQNLRPPAAGVDPTDVGHAGSLDIRKRPGAWSFLDLFIGEETSNRSYVDISRVQQFLFTLVTLLAFGSLTWQLFSRLTPGMRIAQLPPLDVTLIGLLALSHAAYLTAKALPKSDKTNPKQTKPNSASSNSQSAQ